MSGNDVWPLPAHLAMVQSWTRVFDPPIPGYYLPLTMTSLIVDRVRGASLGDYAAFHATNLLLHAVTVAAVYVILWCLARRRSVSMVGSMLFAVHPLTVQSLAWIAERKALLSAMFAMLGVAAHVRFAQTSHERFRAGLVVCYAAALLAKPTAITLPLALLVLDVWPLDRFGRRAVLEKWPLYTCGAISAWITLGSMVGGHAFGIASGTSPGYVLRRTVMALGQYARLVVWPVPISVVRATPPVPPWGLMLAAILCAVIVATWRRARGGVVGVAAGLVALAPTLGVSLWSTVIVYENYAYWPLALWILAIVYGTRGAIARQTPLALGVCGALVTLYGVATWRSYDVWRDSESLWRQAVRSAPAVAGAHNGLGTAFFERGDLNGARAEFDAAIAADSSYQQSWFNRGQTLARLGEDRLAEAALSRAAILDAADAATACAHGLALQKVGRLREARHEFERAARLRPNDVEAQIRLGTVDVALGNRNSGLEVLERAVRKAPQNTAAAYGLAAVRIYLGFEDTTTVRLLEQVVRRESTWAEPALQLARVRATSADPAIRDPERALVLVDRVASLPGADTAMVRRVRSEAVNAREIRHLRR